jgi:transposase
MVSFKDRMRNFDVNGIEEPDTCSEPCEHRIVIWYHDESTFYANDRRTVQWVHEKHSNKPVPKGEGASMMVADFVSADYGWLRSPDGTESARVIFKAGRNRDGYFTNSDVIDQVTTAMNILSKHYADEDHVFVFDNATTHTKRADMSLSALKMPLNPTSSRFQMWGVDTNMIGLDGKPIYGLDGKIKKQRVRMGDGHFNGQPQSLYFMPDDGSSREHVFKGMVSILTERGINIDGLKRECEDFKCVDTSARCCIRRVLWNQPDFVNIKSVLETHCEARGFQVIFLPKFHCELNFLEQCWGKAKRCYREFHVQRPITRLHLSETCSSLSTQLISPP